MVEHVDPKQGQDEDRDESKLEPNRFWEAKPKRGRRPKYEKAEDLEADCIDYFEWVDDNNLQASEIVKFKENAERWNVPKMRAMTILGLCNFLGITSETWGQWRKRDGFSDICSRVDGIIRQQKFEGAAAGLLNHAIIARDLGLVDKKELQASFRPIDDSDDPKTAAQKYHDSIGG